MKKVKRKSSAPTIKKGEKMAGELPSVSIGDLAEKNMMDYGAYTIYSRAISMLYDGLKPVHRRSIYAMYDNGMLNNTAHKKAARVYGEVIGKYHPHGDAAVYGAMIGISTGAGTPTALIDGQGNWGNYNGEGPLKGAASGRYTECRLTKYATDNVVPRPYMDKDVIPYVPNYDGSESEPLYLPSLLPTGFLIGTEGIAVGVSVNMPAYTYESVLAATKTLFKTGSGKKAARKLVPTQRWGSVLLSDQKDLDEYHETGNGRFEWTAPYEVKRESAVTIIRMTGLPPVAYATLHASIMGNEKKAGIKGVHSMIDLTSKKGMLFEIRIKDEAALPAVKKKLTVPESYRSSTTLLVKSDDPEVPLKVAFESWAPVTILEKWMEWRTELEVRLIKSLIRDNDRELHRLRLLVLAASKLDIIFAILKAKGGDKIAMLEKKLMVSHEDAKTIWEMAVRQLDKLNADAMQEKIRKVERDNKALKLDLKAPADRVLRQLTELPTEDPNAKRKKAA